MRRVAEACRGRGPSSRCARGVGRATSGRGRWTCSGLGPGQRGAPGALDKEQREAAEVAVWWPTAARLGRLLDFEGDEGHRGRGPCSTQTRGLADYKDSASPGCPKRFKRDILLPKSWRIWRRGWHGWRRRGGGNHLARARRRHERLPDFYASGEQAWRAAFGFTPGGWMQSTSRERTGSPGTTFCAGTTPRGPSCGGPWSLWAGASGSSRALPWRGRA